MTTMHASAPTPTAEPAEADMFGPDPSISPANDTRAPALRLQFSGTLAHDAEVRSKPVGDGQHVLPVLCLDLCGVGPALHALHAEQIYSEATRKQAEQLARTLKKGQRVSLSTSLLDMRVFLPHVDSISIDPEKAQP